MSEPTDSTSSAAPRDHEVVVPGAGPIRYTERGHGRPFLVLHGGGGPFSVTGLAAHLSETRPARTIVPTMPGFDASPRPTSCRSIDDVARIYLAVLDILDLREVTVIGSSAGGWVAAAMAVAQAGRGVTDDRVGGIVLMNAVGITVEGHPIRNVAGLRIDQLADLSYAEPDRFRIDPTTLPAARRELMAANAATFADYAGDPYMHDPALAGALAAVTVPTLVLWGEADRIVDLDYGRAYAAAILGADFVPVARAGHLPHMEQPDTVRDRIWDFSRAHTAPRSTVGQQEE